MAKRHLTEDSYQRDPWFRALVKAMTGLKSEADTAAFLRDIGTLSELQAWSERLEVARLLQAGKTYRQIAKDTGASTTTVTRVAKFLEDGEGGYRSVLSTHRHDRMVSGVHHHPETNASREEKPVSVPQKNLRKAK